MPRKLHPLFKLLFGSLTLCMLNVTVQAHELQSNRVTVVLRDQNHLVLHFYINFFDALHRASSPDRSVQEFALKYSTMAPAEFQKELMLVQNKFQQNTRVGSAGEPSLELKNWVWPSAEKIQTSLREQLMQAMVAPGEHRHDTFTEVQADTMSNQVIDSVTLQLPEEFQPAMVVSYKPKQVLLETKEVAKILF